MLRKWNMETGSPRNRGLQKTYLVDGKNVTACKMRIISLNIVGLLRKEMAVVLDVKSSTIDSHFNRIYKPLTLYRGRQLVTWSLKNGFDEMGKLERWIPFWWHNRVAVGLEVEATRKPWIWVISGTQYGRGFILIATY
jgi:hypothetical protein